jgi:hypothetical protein
MNGSRSHGNTLTVRHSVPAAPEPSGVARRPRLNADAVAVLLVTSLACLAAWDLLRDGTMGGMDTVTAFYPWFSFLGEQLRAGHLPLWNPFQFAGTPFAADPESGWTYIPAMVLFTLLPLNAAANAYLLMHLLLAGLAAYALGRSVGMPAGGAFVAAIAYGYSGFYFGHNLCCFAYAAVAAWLPVGLLGVEIALRAMTWRTRLAGWAVAGLAMSQILAMYLGQGAYYAALYVGGFLAYRTLLAPPSGTQRRLAAFALNGTGVLLLSLGLSSAGLLPRLEYNALSNLPGGYAPPDPSATSPGLLDWGIIEDWQTRLLMPGFHYVGWVVLALALAAPLLARARFAVPFFAAASVVTLVIARWSPTPLNELFNLLPWFERIHGHAPERALIVFFLGPAMLAGASASQLAARMRGRWPAIAATALISVLVLADFRLAWAAQLSAATVAVGAYELHPMNLERYYQSTPAAQFLRAASQPGEPDQFRYLGYAGHVFGGPMPYTLRWWNPKIVALEVNNRGLVTGLQDVQGYNPIHFARLDRFMTALNGQDQDYHALNVFESGLSSPLLDLLGARYIVLPSPPESDEVLPHFTRPMTSVYQDGDVQILENPSALPRAWIVHAASQAAPDAALQSLSDGDVDPRAVALLEEPPPPLQPAADSEARILSYDNERIELRTATDAAGMLVLGELYDPSWHAYVDEALAHVYAADGALRAVALPAGEHRVEFRYEPPMVRLGLLITVATLLALAACLLAPTVFRTRSSLAHSPPDTTPSPTDSHRSLLSTLRINATRGRPSG